MANQIASPATITKLPGDASTRCYYRLQDNAGQSWIIMDFDGEPQSLAEEKTHNKIEIDELPFTNVQRMFHAANIPVPSIVQEGEGYLVLTDLGDTTLYDWLQADQDEVAI